MIETAGDVRGWFHERLGSALSNQRVEAAEATRFYLVELLAGFAQSPAGFGEPFVFQLAEAARATGAEQLERYRSMGDTALYSCGFFPDHLERRGLSRAYVVSMGCGAYRAAGSLARYAQSEGDRRAAYGELSAGFERFARVLDEVRESTALRTPQDIVRLYERWKRTRAPHLAARLRAEGVFPALDAPDGVLH